MYEVVICTVNTGRVERRPFDTWEAARRFADSVTEKKGRKVRVWLDRIETTIQPPAVRPGRSIAA